MDSFVWYDLETFGTDPFYDRIAQFAAQRTDMNLNPVEDPAILYCRLSADYLPDPAACLVTGITPQEVKRKGIPESLFIEQINSMFSVKDTCVCGFNSIKFDDEFIRNALYRNFMDPYEREWKNGCSRWDIIDLVRAVHDFRPEGINWPVGKNGNPVFKLTELTAANNINQEGAHDAMVDVNATIAVARLIKQKQPRLFDYYFRLRSKVEVKNFLKLQEIPDPLLHASAIFTNPRGCTSMIVPLSPQVDKDNSIICFDLSKDPAPLLDTDAQNVQKVPGIFRMAINRSPFIATLQTLKHQDYRRLGIDYGLCIANYKKLMDNRPALIAKLRTNTGETYPKPEDPDFQIYSGFFSDYDKHLFEVIRKTPPQERLRLNLNFHDPRCPSMLWRHVCRNYPELLDAEETKKWKSFAATRLLCPPGNPINDIYFVERKVKENLQDTALSPRDKQVLAALGEYLVSLKEYVGLRETK